MYVPPEPDCIRQGDIFKNIVYKNGYDNGGEVTFDFCVVLTQDCDLEQAKDAIQAMEDSQSPDFVQQQGKEPPNNDKYLNTIILCPAFISQKLQDGTHLSNIGWSMQKQHKDLWKPIPSNNHQRYHYIKEDADFKLPALVVDFKHVLALPYDYINSSLALRVCRLDDLFAHALSQRYSSFLSRVALP